ncbi:MarR family transcriptional regulator [Salirhabdus sp. Marseille-P4669]|uniref:MarR family transcriptional regulator n=1 Tax=Salirhabdus sp. Marseille-P4669 TaxID=2042310 RepID=UPI000C7D5DE3|nr:MarR family transcriptional regulator [Salirhabdus sp. Marseille-P4669]
MEYHVLHKMMNYYRGFNKVLEEDWQKNAQKIGITSAEQHILWILHFENEATMSKIAQLGLWDISTVMQVVKRLKEKLLVEVQKDSNDRRISYVKLTEKGKTIRKESSLSTFQLQKFVEEYVSKSEANKEKVIGMMDFLKDLNTHFYGEQFSNWVENSGNRF